MKTYNWEGVNPDGYFLDKLEPIPSALPSFQKLFQVSATALSIRSEARFSRNAETDLVCRLLLEKKNGTRHQNLAVLERLAQRLKSRPLALGEVVKQQHVPLRDTH